MSSLIINCGTDDWYTVMFDNKPAGQIHIVTTFAPKGGDKYAEMQKKYEEQLEELQREAEEARLEVERMKK